MLPAAAARAAANPEPALTGLLDNGLPLATSGEFARSVCLSLEGIGPRRALKDKAGGLLGGICKFSISVDKSSTLQQKSLLHPPVETNCLCEDHCFLSLPDAGCRHCCRCCCCSGFVCCPHYQESTLEAETTLGLSGENNGDCNISLS